MDNLKILLERIFGHSRSSLEGLAYVLIDWLSTNGFELSADRKMQMISAFGLLAVAIWKLVSRDDPAKETAQ